MQETEADSWLRNADPHCTFSKVFAPQARRSTNTSIFLKEHPPLLRSLLLCMLPSPFKAYLSRTWRGVVRQTIRDVSGALLLSGRNLHPIQYKLENFTLRHKTFSLVDMCMKRTLARSNVSWCAPRPWWKIWLRARQWILVCSQESHRVTDLGNRSVTLLEHATQQHVTYQEGKR